MAKLNRRKIVCDDLLLYDIVHPIDKTNQRYYLTPVI